MMKETEEQEFWKQLCEEASEFDIEVTDQGETFYLSWALGGQVASFPRNTEGINQALDWIENTVEPEYDS